MKKIYIVLAAIMVFISAGESSAQGGNCKVNITNMMITQASAPVPQGANKCQYKFNLSFDMTVNNGFKYVFFHSWLANEYIPVFNCGKKGTQEPGDKEELGTAVDDPGKSFLDLGFIDLNSVLLQMGTPVDVTNNIATIYGQDPDVVLTQPANSPGMTAYITKMSASVWHFDITNVRIIVNLPCGAPIMAKSEAWGSNQNPKWPAGQCYACDLSHSYNQPSVAFNVICEAPYKYSIGFNSVSAPMNVIYQLYSHNPVQDVNTGGIPIPSASDELIYTSGSVSLNNNNGFSFSEIKQLPNPYCCVDPWTQYSYFVKITSPDFQNILLSNVVEPGCAALPIKLKTFTAVRNKANVTLSWVTELEENNKGFEIQRLSGSGNWQTVGFVNTAALNGNSSIPLNYGFTEINNTKGISQYRLKEVDLSNKHFYSPIRSVRGDGQKTMLIIYPNPSTNGKINIIFEEAVATRDVSVIDINGRVIKMWKGITNNNLQVENLNPGLYSVRIVDSGSGEQTVEKFVIKNR